MSRTPLPPEMETTPCTVVRFASPDDHHTALFAAAWAGVVEAGVTFFLFGDLGAGKTAFARGLITALQNGKEDCIVTSPTFTLLNPYPAGRLPVHHFDLYRLGSPDELETIGAEECFADPAVTLIEWPERGGDQLPADHLAVHINFLSASAPVTTPDDLTTLAARRRFITVTASGTISKRVWHAFVAQFGTEPDHSRLSRHAAGDINLAR
ncbi:MAG: tRNA (adenosine(37)-N6)-threonylcarbamoyltransferase complex ATPase subunit type 1 TsaE [Magnetococcales bacterium]|nr:tRNA (adenosine(37)-N6)-threonylcarbamoyltransferase complex ATPase subunit type 1 TsaE [Magnetococcales bacterium]